MPYGGCQRRTVESCLRGQPDWFHLVSIRLRPFGFQIKSSSSTTSSSSFYICPTSLGFAPRPLQNPNPPHARTLPLCVRLQLSRRALLLLLLSTLAGASRADVGARKPWAGRTSDSATTRAVTPAGLGLHILEGKTGCRTPTRHFHIFGISYQSCSESVLPQEG